MRAAGWAGLVTIAAVGIVVLVAALVVDFLRWAESEATRWWHGRP